MVKLNDYITVNTIAESVMRRTDDHHDIDIYDVAEWCAEAMDKIGLREAFDIIISDVEIEDGRGELPFGVGTILGVRDKETGFKVFSSTDEFAADPKVIYTMPITNIYTYNKVGRVIKTNFESGTLQFVYTTYPIDENGFPMVPAETNYKEAVTSYVIYMMDYRLWRKNKLPEKVKVDSEQEWYLNFKKARSANIISTESMENLITSMLKIASDRGPNFTSFKMLNTPTIENY